MSFSYDKVTTGTYNFVSVISNVAQDGATIAGLTPAFTVISAKTHFLDQIKVNSTSQLMLYLKPSKNYLNVLVE